MGSKIGVLKVAAKRLGISFDEYMEHINNGEKHCGQCRQWKPLTAFNIDNSRGDGRTSACVKCRRVDNPQHPWRGKHLSKEHREKIRATLKKRYKTRPHHSVGNKYRLGKNHTNETKRRIARITRKRTPRGENHYAYKDGRYRRRLETRRSVEYKEWRTKVFERDNYTCQKCGDDTGGNLNAHHIKPFANYPKLRLEVSNGVTLCTPCHEQEHA